MAANSQATIIKKIEVTEGHGHHGGAWKVAYADFMTAMMAFFLLLWILSSSDEQKLRGIAEYFTNATLPGGSGVLDGATLGPPGTLTASNGAVVARGAELGKIDDPSPAQWEVRDVTPTADPQEKTVGTNEGVHEYPAAGASQSTFMELETAEEGEQQFTGANTKATLQQDGESVAEDAARFEALQIEIMQAMQDNPDLRPLQQNVVFEKTTEGLRIQIIDQEGKPMFVSGGADMLGAAETLLKQLGTSLSKLQNPIVITGHTDSVPFSSRKSYDNWDLSTDRANATRRFLAASGVDSDRMVRVSGLADTDPLVKDNPKHPSNRRISILLQYEAQKPQRPASEAAENTRSAVLPEAEKMNKPTPVSAPVPTETIATSQVIDDSVFENLRSALR